MLLRVHHVRLLHVVPRGVPLDECGQWSTDPATDPGQWLAGLERPEDLSVRMCGMLADQAVAPITPISVLHSLFPMTRMVDPVPAHPSSRCRLDGGPAAGAATAASAYGRKIGS
ncbi:hypothetical protein ABZV67_40985 [Streptomyces sp. NPDC005065]|uniref:hypothetical protein n=1 Tax=Streptomyces sp. NPDC005065 TaxID=3154461 RepID=UPI00339E470D